MVSFTRYLAAKTTVDDRALNRHVWEALERALPATGPASPLRVLEIGAGIGTMIERMAAWGLLTHAVYTAVDADLDNIRALQKQVQRVSRTVTVEAEAADVFEFVAREQGRRTWDLIVAHAFLDLVDAPALLPSLFALLPPGGLFYFTINFDGATILEPVIDAQFDALVESLYHRTMDERVRGGKPSGDSRSGRHLFHQIREAGAEILAAGSSDWVVFAGPDGYPDDEATFLHFIIHTIHKALSGRPELDQGQLDAWISQRHAHIEAGTLVYIAHQIDFLGRLSATRASHSQRED
ncbi:MAG: class I SAM-dependent methyltransferase [Anaerolineae bacterium]